MSALLPKADIDRTCRDVRFVPKADSGIVVESADRVLLLLPALEGIHQPCRCGFIRPNDCIAGALQLDQISCRQRILSGGIKFHAAIAHHELFRLEIRLPQCLLDRIGFGRPSALNRVREDK